jgi:hypothetical protein
VRPLTAKQRAFANLIAEGKDGSAAYREAYVCPNSSPITLAREAHRTRELPHVAAYIAQLIAQQERKRFLTRERKRELLADCAEDKKAKWSERTKALEVDNVMTGDNAPQQVQVFGLTELLAIVRKS